MDITATCGLSRNFRGLSKNGNRAGSVSTPCFAVAQDPTWLPLLRTPPPESTTDSVPPSPFSFAHLCSLGHCPHASLCLFPSHRQRPGISCLSSPPLLSSSDISSDPLQTDSPPGAPEKNSQVTGDLSGQCRPGDLLKRRERFKSAPSGRVGTRRTRLAAGRLKRTSENEKVKC